MKVSGRFICAISLIALAVTPCPADCDNTTGTRPKNLTMLFWGASVDKPIMDFFYHACRSFEKEHDGVSIQVDFYSVEQYKTKLPLLMAMNTPPDIFMTWAGAYLETYVKAGKVLPLNDALNAAPEWRKTFASNAFNSLHYDGKIYAVPTSMAVAVLFYNKRIFKRFGLEPPGTYDDLKRIVTILHDEGVTPMAFGNKEPWVSGMLAGQIIQRVGGRSLLSDVRAGNATCTDPSFAKAADVLLELNRLGAFPNGFNDLTYTRMISMFSEEQAAMMLMGTWYFQNLFSESSLPVDSVGVTPFPVFNGETGAGDIWMGQTDMNLAVSSQCREKETAVAFLKYISSLSSQAQLFKQTGALPVTRIAIDNSQCRPEIISMLQLLEPMKDMFLFPDILLGGVAGHEFNAGMKDILSGTPPETVFNRLQQTLHSDQ